MEYQIHSGDVKQEYLVTIVGLYFRFLHKTCVVDTHMKRLLINTNNKYFIEILRKLSQNYHQILFNKSSGRSPAYYFTLSINKYFQMHDYNRNVLCILTNTYRASLTWLAVTVF